MLIESVYAFTLLQVIHRWEKEKRHHSLMLYLLLFHLLFCAFAKIRPLMSEGLDLEEDNYKTKHADKTDEVGKADIKESSERDGSYSEGTGTGHDR